jgi:hypothetical protein
MHTAHAKRIVDDQRDFVRVCNLHTTSIYAWVRNIQIAYLSYLTNRTDVVLGVSNRLHKYSLGFLIDSRVEF